MSKVGQRLIASAREAREIVPDTIHMAAIPYLRLDGPTLTAVREANEELGKWVAAALDEPTVCAEMKADINRWFAAIELLEGK